jgi:hypothetical protein
MTEEQKFIFDLKGYLLIPEVLKRTKIDAVKEQIETIRSNPESLPTYERRFPGGTASMLIDHPAVMDILDEVIGEVRMESSWFTYRTVGDKGPTPHGGGRNVNPNFNYQCNNGKIYSALTRVVFELNEVKAEDGGTLFMPGSHKANFSMPENHRSTDSPLLETYSCPPGSVIIFTENLCHSGDEWKNPDRPRIAVFNCYNFVGCQFHKPSVPQHIVEHLPPEQKAFFRNVWVWNQGGPNNGRNLNYDG